MVRIQRIFLQKKWAVFNKIPSYAHKNRPCLQIEFLKSKRLIAFLCWFLQLISLKSQSTCHSVNTSQKRCQKLSTSWKEFLSAIPVIRPAPAFWFFQNPSTHVISNCHWWDSWHSSVRHLSRKHCLRSSQIHANLPDLRQEQWIDPQEKNQCNAIHIRKKMRIVCQTEGGVLPI